MQKEAAMRCWNDGPAREAICAFVERVSRKGGPEFVPPEQRIAVFDNDGTLWPEKPFYFQGLFGFDRVRALAPGHPDWRHRQPFKAVLENDMEALAAGGMEALAKLVMATHADITTAEFERIVRDWLGSARHPEFGQPFDAMVYQPMIELLAYLRASGFKTYIVSGGGIEFIRTFSEQTYGIPPEQVIGSSIRTSYRLVDGCPALVREAELDFINDEAGKPVGINRFIGRRPILGFGNSDGDLEMLEWITSGAGPRLGVLLHHNDADREYAYDRQSSVGRLARGLDEAAARGWVLVDMKADWNRVFPFGEPKRGG
jgi:phosphoglycolate phosphatase-like HAD superfamily hydrolase